MIHLCGWSESQDSATLVPTAALADPSMTVSGDNIQVPDYAPNLLGCVAIGANVTRAQIQAPSLRRIINLEVDPLNVNAEPLSPPLAAMPLPSPLPLDVGEQLQAYMSEDATGASQVTILAWLVDKAIEPVSADIYSVRVTAATTLVAYTWTNAALTFDQVLPVGRYAIVGANFQSAGLLAFRFLFQAYTPRPGGLGRDAASDLALPGQRRGGWGVWGDFHSTTPPTVDFLSISADTSEVGVLDLVKLE